MHKIRRNILKKIYFNIEKEEKWLNSLSKKGLNLVDINNNYYIFEDSHPNIYQYKIDFIKPGEKGKELKDYLINNKNVEIIYNDNRFVYLKRLSSVSDTPFEIYTDINSKINFYLSYNNIKYLVATLLICTSLNFYNIPKVFFIINIIKIILGVLCLISALKIQKKVLKLTMELRGNEHKMDRE